MVHSSRRRRTFPEDQANATTEGRTPSRLQSTRTKVVGRIRYEIAIRGQLGRALSVLFESMEVRSSGPDETCLVGEFQDQSALQGFLAEVGDLGLELAAVRPLAADE